MLRFRTFLAPRSEDCIMHMLLFESNIGGDVINSIMKYLAIYYLCATVLLHCEKLRYELFMRRLSII